MENLTSLMAKAKESQRVIVEIIFSILDFLLKFVSPSASNAHPNKFNPREKVRKCNLESFQKSRIIQSMVGFLEQYGIHFREFAMLVFDVMRELAKDQQLARKLCSENALSVVIRFLACNSRNLRRYEVHLGFEVIWNTLSRVGRKAMQGLLNQKNILHVMTLFTNILVQTCKLEDKCLRNELMILFCYVLDNARSEDFYFDSHNFLFEKITSLQNLQPRAKSKRVRVRSTHPKNQENANNLNNLKTTENLKQINTAHGPEIYRKTFDEFLATEPSMAQILFFLATCDESPEHKAEYFDTSNEDLQFKLLVYYSMSLLIKGNSDSPQIRLFIEQTVFVEKILFHIRGSSNRKFSEPQKREIETEILRLLAKIIQIVFKHFLDAGGITVLLEYMVKSRDSQKKILCLQIFLALLEIQDEDLRKVLDETLVDHVIDNVSGDIDLHSLEDIGGVFFGVFFGVFWEWVCISCVFL